MTQRVKVEHSPVFVPHVDFRGRQVDREHLCRRPVTNQREDTLGARALGKQVNQLTRQLGPKRQHVLAAPFADARFDRHPRRVSVEHERSDGQTRELVRSQAGFNRQPIQAEPLATAEFLNDRSAFRRVEQSHDFGIHQGAPDAPSIDLHIQWLQNTRRILLGKSILDGPTTELPKCGQVVVGRLSARSVSAPACKELLDPQRIDVGPISRPDGLEERPDPCCHESDVFLGSISSDTARLELIDQVDQRSHRCDLVAIEKTDSHEPILVSERQPIDPSRQILAELRLGHAKLDQSLNLARELLTRAFVHERGKTPQAVVVVAKLHVPLPSASLLAAATGVRRSENSHRAHPGR